MLEAELDFQSGALPVDGWFVVDSRWYTDAELVVDGLHSFACQSSITVEMFQLPPLDLVPFLCYITILVSRPSSLEDDGPVLSVENVLFSRLCRNLVFCYLETAASGYSPDPFPNAVLPTS